GACEEPSHRNGWLLCARCERPRGRRAAEQRDERAPVLIELHAIRHDEQGAAPQDIELAAISQRVARSRLRRPQQVSSRGLAPRLSIGTLQLSIRCSSIHFLPKRSFPVSTLEIRLVSGCLAVCDCSFAMAGNSGAMMSEDAKPSTRLRAEGRMGALPDFEADRAGWLKRLRRTLRFLLPHQGSHRAGSADSSRL